VGEVDAIGDASGVASPTRRIVLASALLAALGAAPGEPLSRDPAPLPERHRGVLPARIDPASLTSTERLRSLSLARLPQHHQVVQQLCRGETEVRARFLDGLRRALAESGHPLRWAYWQIATACPQPDHCAWLTAHLDGSSSAVRDFLWRAIAHCRALDEPALFERADAPDDAVVTFHARRERTDAVHSERLARVVERRAAAGEPGALRDALAAYARMDHPQTAARLIALHGRAADPERRLQLALAMRNQADPAASRLFFESCHENLEARTRAWEAAGGDLHGSPTRWGDPCRSDPAAAWLAAGARAAEPGSPDPLRHVPPDLGRSAWLPEQAEFQFGDRTLLLRQLFELVRPELDGVVLEDVWPAVDAVALHRGQLPVQAFVNGDGVTLHVPERDGGPDLEVAERIRDELLVALRAPRCIDVWLRGERLRFAYAPGDDDDYDVTASLAIANRLLIEVGSGRRIARLATEVGLAVLVAPPDALERAAARGLLAARP
jgi:hypothetical protein